MDPGSTQCIVERGDHGPWTLVAPMRACYRAPLGPSVGVFGGVERRRAGDGGGDAGLPLGAHACEWEGEGLRVSGGGLDPMALHKGYCRVRDIIHQSFLIDINSKNI